MLTEDENWKVEYVTGLITPKPPSRGGRLNKSRSTSLKEHCPVKLGN